MRAHPELVAALRVIVDRIDASIPQAYTGEPVEMFIAGGIAMNYYCGSRYTEDVDASFSKRLLLNFDELRVSYVRGDGSSSFLYLDPNYNTSFALIHEDFEDDSVEWTGIGNERRRIRVRVFSALDLAVSKIARFSDQDREDILSLVSAGLINQQQLRDRASESLRNFIGDDRPVRHTLDFICTEIARGRQH